MADAETKGASTRIKGIRGAIVADVAYPLEVFIMTSGIGRKALAKLRRQGMPIHRAGRQSFIIGAQFISALVQQSDA